MTNITAKVTGASIVASADGKLTSGMVGVSVHIEYDETWAGLKKNVSFKANNFQRTRKDVSGDITVPWEVMRQPNKTLSIGVEGVSSDGDIVFPTVWAVVGRIEYGANSSVPAAGEPLYDGSGGGSVVIDKTLSISGAAADAAVVGEKLGDIETALDNIISIQEELIGGGT